MLVSTVIDPAKKAIGGCDDDVAMDYISRAVDLLQQESNFDPQTGYMDICTQECIVTLPDEVEIPLAVNVGGRPSDFRNKWFEFHLNGPGSECCNQNCQWAWEDLSSFGTFRDPTGPSSITAISNQSADGDGVINLLVYGYDQEGVWVMSDKGDGVLSDGIQVPIYQALSQANCVGNMTRITKIVSPTTAGFIRAYSYQNGTTQPILLAIIKPWEKEPEYRRIKLHGNGVNLLTGSALGGLNCQNWVRMRFRKKQYPIRSMDDFIFLSSTNALIFAIQAVRKYDLDLLDEGDKYMNKAIYCLERKEKIDSGPSRRPIQVRAPVFKGNANSNMV